MECGSEELENGMLFSFELTCRAFTIQYSQFRTRKEYCFRSLVATSLRTLAGYCGVSGYSMNRPLLSDAGRSEAIKLVTMGARTGAACALPNLGHIDVFQQLEAARRKI